MDNLTKGALGATIVVILGGAGLAVNSTIQRKKIEKENLALREQVVSEQQKREDDKAAEMERKLEESQEVQRRTQEQMNAQLAALREQMAATAKSATEERRIMEEERAALSETIAEKVRKEEEIVGRGSMTALQKKIREAASIGKVEQIHEELGFVIVSAGSSNGIQPEQRYNIRRDMFLVGEVVISSVEDESNSVANIVPGSTQPGLSIRPGDEIIGEIY
jgi:hypothetical protein